jgi:hypothetical protein
LGKMPTAQLRMLAWSWCGKMKRILPSMWALSRYRESLASRLKT